MQSTNTIFFGSTSDSVIVLEKILRGSTVRCQVVVTQPTRPIGRKQILTPTPVEEWAKTNKIPVLSFSHCKDKPWLFENEQTVVDALQPFKTDLIVSACFGQKIPIETIRAAKFGGLNVHPSLLPRWRGADPVPWAILTGDHQTGVTIVTLEKRFDEGKIISQQKYPITDKDMSDPVRTKLFQIGADLLVSCLPDFLSGKNTGKTQDRTVRQSNHNNKRPLEVVITAPPYAKRFTRADGFIPWDLIKMAMDGQIFSISTISLYGNVPLVQSLIKGNYKEVKDTPLAHLLDRAFRALSPWPGVWTEIDISSVTPWETIKISKRLKILSYNLISHPSNHNPSFIPNLVQLEGKNPVSFDQFREAYLKPSFSS